MFCVCSTGSVSPLCTVVGVFAVSLFTVISSNGPTDSGDTPYRFSYAVYYYRTI